MKLGEVFSEAAKDAKPEENRKWYTQAQQVMGVYHHYVLTLLLNDVAVSPVVRIGFSVKLIQKIKLFVDS